MNRWLLLSLFLLLHVSLVRATHMVGGEINYRCLGNNQYEVSLTVFRDCDTGVPWFDNPAALGVFDANNQLVYDVRLPLTSQNDTLVPVLSDPCLVVPPNVCIHTTTYKDTIYLPFIAGGYQLVYQRCCRNQDIVNIIDPLGTGATYSSYVSEEALLGCNNSAVFREWPPVYICMGYPIHFDHSAIDADGDSIVYEMCDPWDGATPFNPMPQPPFNPPYNPVVWQPGYGTNNMLGGSTNPLAIDPATGLLTGTPNSLGVFVVGVCANEYRNGVLISTTKRDFQYAVGVCGLQVSSAFFSPSIQCDNSLIVSFDNNSDGITNTYQWNFGDPTNPNAGSTLENPAYIYPDTGRYTITLIADPGSACADTSTREIYLQYESILMDFDLASASCTDVLQVDVTDLTIDTISTIVEWNWNFGNGQTANVPYASTVYTQSGTYFVTLSVEAANGCTASLRDTVVIDLPQITSNDTVGICPGSSSIVLNPNGNPNHQYQWSPGQGLSSTTAVSPVANPTQTTTYFVTVTAFNGLDTCVLQRSVTVVIPPPIDVQLPPDSTTCQNNLTIAATSNTAVQWEWAYNANFNPLFSTQNPVTVPLMQGSSLPIFVRGTDAYGCRATDTVMLTQSPLPIVVDFSYNSLSCNANYTVQFTDQTTDVSQGTLVQWQWNFGDGSTSAAQHPQHSYSQSGTYIVSLLATSSQGCSGVHLDTISVNLPLITSNDTVGVCPGQTSVVLNPGGNPAFTYSWSPAGGLSSTTAPSPTATIVSPTNYTVTVTAMNDGQPCTAIHTVHVLFSPAITVTSPPQVVYCGNTVTLTATSSTAVSYAWAGDPSFFTILSTSNPATFTPTTFPYAGYYVQATNAYGCTATDYTIVERRTTPINVQFGFSSLGCSSSMQIQFTDLTTDLAGSTVASWFWTTSNGQTSNQQNPIFTFNNSQTYVVTLTITLANGCSGTKTQSIPLNIASLNSNSTVGVCEGQSSVQLNPGGSAALQYQWSGAGLSSLTAPSPIATPPSLPTTYYVTVTGYNSLDTCVNAQAITVVDAPPLALSIPADTLFCETPFMLFANYNPGPGITLQWATNPIFSPVALTNVNPVYINFGTTPADFVLYARLLDSYGCSVTDTTILRFRTAPINVSFAMDALTCSDTLQAQMSNVFADASSAPVSAWNWTFSNGMTSGQQSPTIPFTGSGPHTATLNVTLANGCAGTATNSLLIDVPTITSADSVGLCDHASVQLNPGGNPNFQYQWAPAQGLSSTTAPSPIANPTTTTTYTVTVTAPNGGDTCQLVRDITVGAGWLGLQAMPDTLVCDNAVELYVENTNLVLIDWALDPNFLLIIGQTNPFYTNLNQSRWFYVRGRDAFGCDAIDSVYVQVKNTPVVANFNALPLHCGDSLLVQFNDLTSDTTDNPITAWFWTFGNGQTATTPNPIIEYEQSGTYTVRLDVTTQSGCVGSATRDITILLPELYLGSSLIVCEGDTALLNDNPRPGLTYSWTPSTDLSDPNAPSPLASPDTTTTYTVTVLGYFEINGVVDTCRNTADITVIVSPLPEVEALGGGIVCGDTATTLLASVSDSVGYAWSVDPNFTNIIGQDSLLQVPVTGQTTTYYVRVRNKNVCEAVDSIQVVGNVVEIAVTSDQVPCSTEPVRLTVQVISGVADSLEYRWEPDAALLSGQGTGEVVVLPDANQLFQVVATNAWGCSDTAQATVQAAAGIPALDLTATPDTVWSGETVTLQATANAGYSYVWGTHPTLTAGNSPTATAQPIQPTIYTLTITDSFGCINSDSVAVFVRSSFCDEPNIFIPNTFTPNGDGLNDILYVRGAVISEVYFTVYDRWGEKVFETEEVTQGWDGTFRGRALPPDVYGYYLRCVCVGGAEYFKKGNVTLMR